MKFAPSRRGARLGAGALHCLLVFVTVAGVRAESTALPFLSSLFADHMVLQRGKPNTFWGWTNPGATVRVEINGLAASAVAASDGRWEAQVEPPAAPGTACVVTIDGPQHVVLHDVVVGDVWICAGQSNMQFALAGANDGAREVAAADHPEIRLFTVATHAAYGPTATLKGHWKVCSPETVVQEGGFSAVGYFFARHVQEATGVPIGLIQDCLGGTPVETWMSATTLQGMTDFARPMAEIARLRREHAPEYGNYIMHWYDDYDPGIRGKGWADPNFDDHDWKTVQIPGAFGQLGLADVPAVCWFRREIILPDPLPAGTITLNLGVVERMDTAYVNGRSVGASSWVENPRRYPLRAGLLKPGRNQITLRIFKLVSKEAFLSPPGQIDLALPDGSTIPLAGDWKGAVAVDARPPHPLPLGYDNYPTMPATLYLGMIEPLEPFALTGVLWYQGEANASRAHQYRTLLPAMIQDWRNGFKQGDLPFLIAGLPVFSPHKDQPGTDDWAELREAQSLTVRRVPNTGLAITVDTGDAANLHPKDKQTVGDRLALIALATRYGKNIPYRGPTFHSMEKSGHEQRITFDHTEGGLQVHGEKPGEFAVAGHDRAWHWADARIDGDTVIVSSPEVPEPEAVRYAWQSNPKANLYNGAGLPAEPFRTDDWPGITDDRPPW